MQVNYSIKIDTTRRHSIIITSLVLLLSFFVGASFLYIKPLNAMSLSDWNAGHIIDDSVFTDSGAMNSYQIQLFLNSKVPTCDTNGTQPATDFDRSDLTHAQYAASRGWPAPPYPCLKDYVENGLNAAQLIDNAAKLYQVNPQVLIVLLQKEQGLLTDTWPLPIQYRSATGYGCPDNAPCDSQYYGLTNQIKWSAIMFHSIMTTSSSWYTPYILGNNYVQYNPIASCGGSTINIDNRATQSLYNYTPYQPNSATLNWRFSGGPYVSSSYPGCGAFGNINFYTYFRNWFGSTIGPVWSASIQSQMLYSDPEMTIPLTKVGLNNIVTPGQTIYGEVYAQNTGRGIWDGYANLGTANPGDRISLFASPTWPAPQRVTGLSNSPIEPEDIGIFKFTMKVPSITDGYGESFGIVIDGQAWTNAIVNLSFIVSDPVTYPAGYDNNVLDSSGKNTLNAGDYMLSPDGYSSLSITEDGLIILRNDYQQTWNPIGKAGVGSRLVMQNDGNLVLYNKDWNPVWNSNTPDKGPSRMIVQEDGNLVIYNATGATWSSNSSIGTSHFNFATSFIAKDSVLYAGQLVQSVSRKYSLHLQKDGNLVLYSPNGAVWSSNTVGSNALFLSMQADGNLVLYNKYNVPVWGSGTAGKGASSFFVQGDGNLVIYNSQGYTWASSTEGK